MADRAVMESSIRGEGFVDQVRSSSQPGHRPTGTWFVAPGTKSENWVVGTSLFQVRVSYKETGTRRKRRTLIRCRPIRLINSRLDRGLHSPSA